MKNSVGKKILYILVLFYVYGLLIYFLLFNNNDANGLGLLIFYNFFIAVPFCVFILYVLYKQGNVLKKRRGVVNIFLNILGVVVFVPLISIGGHRHVAMLFVDLEYHTKNLKNAKVIMMGGVQKNLNRFSGISSFPIMSMEVDGKMKEEFIPVCNLLLPRKCHYGSMVGKTFNIRYIHVNYYPLKHGTIIYEIYSLDGDVNYGLDYHVKYYKKNKRLIIYFLFFIMLFSLLIVFFIMRVLWLEKQK